MGNHQLFLSLGGNLGNKAEIFAETRDLIRKKIGSEMALSSVFASEPWGFTSEDEFWNQVMGVITLLSPRSVIRKIREIEDHFGRKREHGVYLSRKMDIDLLFYDKLVVNGEDLVIPHPLIACRRFVLTPLAEVIPGYIHPVTGKSIIRMLEECTDNLCVVKTSQADE